MNTPSSTEISAAVSYLSGRATSREIHVLSQFDPALGIRDAALAIFRGAQVRILELEADAARLDLLDEINRKINQDHGTEYGWRFDVNHNRAQVSLTDCNLPALTVRAAIDQWREDNP